MKPTKKGGKKAAAVVETVEPEEELKESEIVIDAQSRETEADRTGDERSLDRRLDRTLYLLVKRQSGWGFPGGAVEGSELLHEVRSKTSTTWS